MSRIGAWTRALAMLAAVSFLRPPAIAAARDEAGAAPPDGALVEVSLEVRDMARQVAFYRDTLGLRVTHAEGERQIVGEPHVRLATPQATLALHARTDPGEEASFGLTFMAADIVARRKELLSRGVDLGPIRNPAWGVLVTDGRDPERNRIRIEARVDPTGGSARAAGEAREAVEAWLRAYDRGDRDAYLGFFADDPRFHLHEPGRQLYTSKRQVRAALDELYASVTTASLTAERPAVTAVSADLALATASFEQTMTLDGGVPLAFSGTMHLLLVRSEAGWRILAGDTLTRVAGPDSGS